MNEEKAIAQAILDAQKMREESYNETCNAYNLSIEECLMTAGKKHGLSKNLWSLLALAMEWWNDVQLWAKDILAGKDMPTQ